MKHEISPLLRQFLQDWQAYVAKCEENPDYAERHPYMKRMMGLCDNSSYFMRSKNRGEGREPLTQEQAYILTEELKTYFDLEYDLGLMKEPLATPAFPFDHDEFFYITEDNTWKNPMRNAWVAEQLS